MAAAVPTAAGATTLTAGVTTTTGGGVSTAVPAAAWAGKLVSHHVIGGNLNALAKIATLFNVLWRTATSACCKAWTVDDYQSAGSFHPAVSVKRRRQRDQRLQEGAAGVGKAMGKRNHTVSDAQRRDVCLSLLVTPTTWDASTKNVNLNTVWVMQYALEARGATARQLTFSDMAARTFVGMFNDDGKPARVLCTYITATKTIEGITRCIGALPHDDPWLCPIGVVPDALVEWCHPPKGTPSSPPIDFTPIFQPDDDELTAAGVTPALFREAGKNLFFREWYRVLAVVGARGGRMKAMTYRFHNDRVKLLLMAIGVPDCMAKTHVVRGAAASTAKARGVGKSDNKEHGCWSVPMGGGTYDRAIPNPQMMRALSGRHPNHVAPVTPRLNVPVPAELQRTVCPWLEAAEKACGARVAANADAADEALNDLNGLIRWVRSVYFQTMAARLGTASIPPTAYMTRLPLFQHPLFPPFRTLMARTLSAAGEAAAAAVAQVIPPMAEAVRVAVEAVAAASAAETKAIEERMSQLFDASVVVVTAHADAGVVRVNEHRSSVRLEVRSHFDARFNAMERDLARQRELMARLVTDGVLQDPRARELVREKLASASQSAASSSATAEVLRSASHPAALASPSPPVPPRVSRQLLVVRQNVRRLKSDGKLAGVPIFESATECVLLLSMAKRLNWWTVLDEYVNGLEGGVSILETEMLFGK